MIIKFDNNFTKSTQVMDQGGHNVQMCNYKGKGGKHLLKKYLTDTNFLVRCSVHDK